MHAPPAPLLYRTRDAAEVLGVSRGYIHKLINLGVLTPVKIGRSTRVRVADVERLAGTAPTLDTGRLDEMVLG